MNLSFFRRYMFSMKRFFSKTVLLSVFFLFSACDAVVDSAVPIELDLQIGKSFLENARDGKEGMHILKDSALEKYVKSVADRILKSDRIRYKKNFPTGFPFWTTTIRSMRFVLPEVISLSTRVY